MKRILTLICSILIYFVISIFSLNVMAAEWFDIKGCMSDAEYFGAWNGHDWTIKPKLNYDYSEEFSVVGDYVKDGDYGNAKKAFYQYFKNRKPPFAMAAKRNTAQANLAAELTFLTNVTYVNRFSIDSDEFKKYSVDITSLAQGKGVFGVVLSAVDKSNSNIEIKGNGEFIPVLTALVDGQYRSYKATNTHYFSPTSTISNVENLLLRESGIPYDDNCKKVAINFDLSDLSSAANIESAALSLYVKGYDDDETDIFMIVNSDAYVAPKWSTHILNMYSYQGGTADDLVWENPEGSDPEFLYILGRLNFVSYMAYEYQLTHDEYYAENAIKIMLDFIYDTSDMKIIASNGSSNALGGYPRSLDTAGRANNIIPALEIFIHSDTMTPEYYVEMMKNLWQMANFLTGTDSGQYHPNNNWGIIEASGFALAAQVYPEFADSDKWKSLAKERANYMLNNTFMLPDGSYCEDSSAYTNTTLGYLVQLRECYPDSSGLGEEFDRHLDNLIEFNLNISAANGEDIRWGDSDCPPIYNTGVRYLSPTSRAGRGLALTGNEKILSIFADADGKRLGTPIDYTSKHYWSKQVSILRSGWNTYDLYMFIDNTGNYGSHKHPDDLSLIVGAYGRVLLVDPGRYSYVTSNPIFKELCRTTASHNTISINGGTQAIGSASSKGTDDYFETSSEFDFYQGTTKAWSGFDHTRAVSFVRPNYWIVSDWIDPENVTDENTYDQNWHSSTHFEIFNESGGRTTFDNGVNMQVVQADDTGVAGLKDGYFSLQYGNAKKFKYYKYTKTGAGRVTFDTVLYPNQLNDQTEVSAYKLSSDVNSTAMRIDFDDKSSLYSDYYYMSYLNEDYGIGVFDRFAFDGKCVVVETDVNQEVIAVNISHGTTVMENGNSIVTFSKNVGSATVEWSNVSVDITTNSADVEAVIYAPQNIKTVTINGKTIEFERDGDYIKI